MLKTLITRIPIKHIIVKLLDNAVSFRSMNARHQHENQEFMARIENSAEIKRKRRKVEGKGPDPQAISRAPAAIKRSHGVRVEDTAGRKRKKRRSAESLPREERKADRRTEPRKGCPINVFQR